MLLSKEKTFNFPNQVTIHKYHCGTSIDRIIDVISGRSSLIGDYMNSLLLTCDCLFAPHTETEQKTHSTIGSALLGIEPNMRFNEPHRETHTGCLSNWFST